MRPEDADGEYGREIDRVWIYRLRQVEELEREDRARIKLLEDGVTERIAEHRVLTRLAFGAITLINVTVLVLNVVLSHR